MTIAAYIFGAALLFLLLRILLVLVEIRNHLPFFKDAANVHLDYMRDLRRGIAGLNRREAGGK